MPEQNNSGQSYNPTLAGIGGSIGGTLVGGAMTMLGNYIQQKYYEKNMQQQYNYNERAAKNADRRARALYNDLYSPGAQKQMYVDAGFSPSIMYSQGMQGVSGSTPHGAQGAGANMQMPSLAPLHLDSQFALTAAQIELMKSEARKNNVDADTQEGKNELGKANIQSILANIGLSNSEKLINNLNYEIGKASKDFSIGIVEQTLRSITYQANKQFWDAEIRQMDFTFDVDTYDKRVETVSAELSRIYSDSALKLSQKDLNESEISVNNAKIKEINEHVSQMINEVLQGWQKLALEDKRIFTDWQVRNDANYNQRTQINNLMTQFREKLEATIDIADKDRKQKYVSSILSLVGDVLHAAGSVAGAMVMTGGL